MLGRKRFLHSKGPKNVLSLLFKDDTKHCAGAIATFCIEPEKRQSTFLDGAQGGTSRAKIFSWVNSVLVYGV